MSECWRYGDVLKLRGDWLAREDPDGNGNLRDLRAMVVNEKSIMFIAPTSSPRLARRCSSTARGTGER